jgi:hypothetical protein
MIGVLHQPKNTLPQIDHVYMFVSVDPDDGNEGVVAAPVEGVLMPLVAADDKRLECLMPLAKELATMGNMKIRLIKLSNREVVKEIEP